MPQPAFGGHKPKETTSQLVPDAIVTGRLPFITLNGQLELH